MKKESSISSEMKDNYIIPAVVEVGMSNGPGRAMLSQRPMAWHGLVNDTTSYTGRAGPRVLDPFGPFGTAHQARGQNPAAHHAQRA